MTSRLVNDSTQIKDLLATAVPQMMRSLLTIVGSLVIMLTMDWKMSAIMFLSIPVVLLVMFPILRRMGEIGRQRQDTLAQFNGDTGETLGEIRLVKSSNAELYEEQHGHDEVQKLYRIGLKEAIFDSIAGPLMMAVMMILIIGVLAYGASRVAHGTMTMGTMFAFLMYLFQLMGPASTPGNFFSTLAKANGSTTRVRDLLNEPEEDILKATGLSVDNQTLKVKNVNFAYDPEEPIIQDLSFEAKPNTVVAFAGPSGGGKSTIFSLLERYYEPNSGQILIGDQPITEMGLADWRKQIAFVSQDSAMMAGTIRFNLTYGLTDDYSDDQLWHVLDLAFAADFVKQMPDGLDTTVGERGVRLSGGQRQRIAIARAFLRDAKILMLDEATASLDSESEEMVQKAIEELMKGRTTLVIAHRLSTIVNADTINFVENGHVSDSGTHRELQEKSQLYREYVKTQFNE
ncbi:multidrug ABC transporter ATP-binding/permease protein [Secundilactobacillus oryzae JCM 18671]|uniref:Multidrug resistance ABC transporter ATP-binding and permease protein n=1 Tax=Secundilactobacillus oryzae JCM 18671 TaxID=1291743 RepID=A0A081BGF6_9LACO|nr:multidrug ABC transporter ATP-binding/permease protein [Secundilactobacillus oryzae JCM 18671]